MTIGTIDESQRKAARVVGVAYLLALPPAIFAEFYVRTQLIAFHDAAQTARNIMAHERLFRLGTASNLTVFAIDVGGTVPAARRFLHRAADRILPVAAGARIPNRARAVAAHQRCRHASDAMNATSQDV